MTGQNHWRNKSGGAFKGRRISWNRAVGIVVILAVVTWPAGRCTPAAEPGDAAGVAVPNEAGVAADWKFVDPHGDCNFRRTDEAVTLVVPAGLHNLTPKEDLAAPRLLTPVTGDFSIEVEVNQSLTPGPRSNSKIFKPYHGAGLLLWADEKTFVRLEKNAYWQPVAPDRRLDAYIPLFTVVTGGEADNRSPKIKTADVLNGHKVRLRLTRRGGTIDAAMQVDGKDWESVGSANLTLPEKVHVGVCAVNTSSQGLSAAFTGVTLKVEE